MVFISDGKTSADSFLAPINDYTHIPLLTIGDEIPLLEGEFPFIQTDPAGEFPVPGLNEPPLDGDSPLTASETETYFLPGGLDGVEHVFIDGINYVFVGHNLPEATTTELDGEQINGSRISLLAFDPSWDVIGGRNLVDIVRIPSAEATNAFRNTVDPSSETGANFTGIVLLEYVFDPATGNYEANLEAGDDSFVVGNPTFLASESDIPGLSWQERVEQSFDETLTFNSLNSLAIAESGFRRRGAQALPYVFSGERNLEDTNDGIAYFHIANGITVPILGLGAFRKSQVYSPLDFRQELDPSVGPIGTTVILSLEAFDDGEIYLYRGEQFPGNAGGFVDLEDSLYVLRVRDTEGNVLADEFEIGEIGGSLSYEWVLVDGDPLDVQDAIPEGKAINTLNGDALSDWVNGNDETGALRSTNFNNLGALAEDPNNTGTFYFTTGNRAGSVYSLTFSGDDPVGEGTIELVLQDEGDDSQSYDSITVDANGDLVLEDNNGEIFLYNIADDSLVPIAATNEAVLDPDAVAPWQTEGITEVDDNYQGSGLSAYLSNVDTRSAPLTTDDGGNLASGGQLLLTIPPGTTAPQPFDLDIYRFQSLTIPGTYLYTEGTERDIINSNFSDSFVEEGIAFRASSESQDTLIDLYRFRSNQGTYLYVGEEERNSINNDSNLSAQYIEEGRAFSVYGAGADQGTSFNRLRRTDIPAAYIYATGGELSNIQTNLSNIYVDEGIAFEAEGI